MIFLYELRLEKEEEIKIKEEENKLRIKGFKKKWREKKEENNLYKQYEKKINNWSKWKNRIY